MSQSSNLQTSFDETRRLPKQPIGLLRSLSPDQRAKLVELGVTSLSDLLQFAPVHQARAIVALAYGYIAMDLDLKEFVKDGYLGSSPTDLASASTAALSGIGSDRAQFLYTMFGVKTVEQLAVFPPFMEAEALMRRERTNRPRVVSVRGFAHVRDRRA